MLVARLLQAEVTVTSRVVGVIKLIYCSLFLPFITVLSVVLL